MNRKRQKWDIAILKVNTCKEKQNKSNILLLVNNGYQCNILILIWSSERELSSNSNFIILVKGNQDNVSEFNENMLWIVVVKSGISSNVYVKSYVTYGIYESYIDDGKRVIDNIIYPVKGIFSDFKLRMIMRVSLLP